MTQIIALPNDIQDNPKHGDIRWSENLGRTEFFHKDHGWIDGIDFFMFNEPTLQGSENLTEKSCIHAEYVNSGFYSVISVCKSCGKSEEDCKNEKSKVSKQMLDWILDGAEEEII